MQTPDPQTLMQVRSVISLSAGLDHIDKAAAKARNIQAPALGFVSLH